MLNLQDAIDQTKVMGWWAEQKYGTSIWKLYSDDGEVICQTIGSELDCWQYAFDNDLLPIDDMPTQIVIPPSSLSYRKLLVDLERYALVKDEVDKLVTGQQTFTAYLITLTLRSNNPDKEIEHEDVRSDVAAIMAANNDYSSRNESWNGNNARTWFYSPPTTIVPPVAPILPQEPPKPLQLKSGIDKIDWNF